MPGWAIDLGNTHTRVAHWDDHAGEARLLELPEICLRPGGDDRLEGSRLVPSATHLLDGGGWRVRLGRWGPVSRRFFLGREALIGRPALEANTSAVHPSFVPTFKPFLEREALRRVARTGRRSWSARDVARAFVRELLAEVKRSTGERIRDAVLTAPVEAFESYRAELLRIGRQLGIRRLRFLDEPVAAALGYGLGLERERLVLVVDFGGGTFHMALVALAAKRAEEGTATVIAKEGRAVGGNVVDRWLVEHVCRRLEQPPPDGPDEEASFWMRLLLVEARRVKEALFFRPTETFLLAPPGALRGRPGARPETPLLELRREDLVALLRENGVYRMLEESLQKLLEQAAAKGVSRADVEEVLMVGGSTLLPEVYAFFEGAFGRDRVRAWQPFEAVALGACAYAAGSLATSDFIVHDYAFVTYDARSGDPQYTVIVPRGTRFPTAPDLWKRQLVPTCAMGEPEALFKLVICEIGKEGDGRRFVWDQQGALHKLGEGASAQPVIVPLNEVNPTLGELDPPHQPRDRRPRLEIAFGVNGDRWLTATVQDLVTRKRLLDESPVVRLL